MTEKTEKNEKMMESEYLRVGIPLNVYGCCKIGRENKALDVLCVSSNRFYVAGLGNSRKLELNEMELNLSPSAQIISLKAFNSIHSKTPVIALTYCNVNQVRITPEKEISKKGTFSASKSNMRKHAEGSEELSARRRRRDEQRMDSEEMEDELRYIKGIEDSWLVDPELISCDQQSKAYFLSVFGGKCTSDNCEWPTITEDKQIISLDYIPLGIYTVCKKNEDIILVSGNDKTVHCYKQDATSKQYNEVQLDQVFPELCFLKDKIILTMDFHFNTDTDYSIAIGCQDGTVLVMTTKTETVVSHILFDGPISSIQFFESLYKSKKILNIALGGAIGCAFVLRDVVECGTSNPILLPKSDTFESVLAVSIHNPDNLFDTEILIGTFGKMIIAYKEEATKPGEYKVNWNLPVAHPIFGLLCGDFLGCFNSDLVACTIFGLHYFKNKQ